MTRKAPITNLQRWMTAEGVDIDTLAAALEESYCRIAHYVRRGVIPKPAMVRKLTAHTGMPAEAFLFPYEAPQRRAA